MAAAPVTPPGWKVPDEWKHLHEDQLVEAVPLNETELQTLAAMKTELGAAVIDALPPSMICRFIRGYAREKEPIKESITKLRDCLVWREKQKVDQIAHTFYPNEAAFRKAWPSGFHGRCKQGRPIYVDRVGLIDPHLLNKTFDMETLMKFHIKQMERLNLVKDELAKREGRMIYKHVVIIDMTGFGMAHMGSDFTTPMKTFTHIDSDFYPESLHKLIVCNAPWAFKLLWKMASPWIHQLTRARIKVGSHHLLEYIDEDQLPVFLNGKCKCAAGKCLEVPFEDGRQHNSSRGVGAFVDQPAAAAPAAGVGAQAPPATAASQASAGSTAAPGIHASHSEINEAALAESMNNLNASDSTGQAH